MASHYENQQEGIRKQKCVCVADQKHLGVETQLGQCGLTFGLIVFVSIIGLTEPEESHDSSCEAV